MQTHWPIVFLVITNIIYYADGLNFDRGMEELDADMYREMYPNDGILLSRRREDPMADESLSEDENDDSQAIAISSNLDPELQAVVNSKLQTRRLPPNYHNKTTYIVKINNKVIEVNVTIDERTNNETGSTYLSIVQTANDTSYVSCSATKSCKKGMYCAGFIDSGVCTKCRNVSAGCSSDVQCCGTDGALCVDGICKTGYKKGQKGTICKKTSDCDQGLCCSRKFMAVSLCKPLAKINERCSKAATSFNTIMDGGLCPCEKGLSCTNSDPMMRGLFFGAFDDFLGDTVCRTYGKKQREKQWFPNFFDDDDEFDF